MREGMFLGYKVNADGLKVCLDKVEIVLNLPSPKSLKDVQKINGKLASLNRFLSKLAEKSLPFFKTLKKCTKKSDFQWIAEAEMAFKQIKTLIAELPMLTAPKEKEELVIYLAAAKEAVNAVLMTQMNEKQMHISFVSHFFVERPDDDPPDTPMEDKEELSDSWILFIDGSSCTDGSRAGLIITNPEGTQFTYALSFRFNATNNEAEYEALIAGLQIAKQIGVKFFQANIDSRLAANQVNETYVAKEPGMIKYLENVKILASTFKEFSVKQVPRQVLVEEIKEKSIDEKEMLVVVKEEGRTWMTPIHEYLVEEILPVEKKKARVVRRKARRTQMVSPVEIGMPTLRTAEVVMIKNDEALEINLELLEEKREQAAIQEAKSKAMMEKYYNARVRNTNFKPGDLVYRSNEASHTEDGGKLGPSGKDHTKSQKL
uniref:Reverse transcriptase domain-containing protein n=1 Tax=Tanacetum cinerariifolium TaxID=118510 RepID=A0A699IBX9_TANCI|nr:reverse transcriptase domain-containing protein [Tanacetum cinerariifolium]